MDAQRMSSTASHFSGEMENVLSAVMKTEAFSRMSARFSDLKIGITELSFPRGASSVAKNLFSEKC